MRQYEHHQQVLFFKWAAWKESATPALRNLFAVPNGGQRHLLVAQKLKAEGVRAGVPDIFLACPSGGKHGLFIEMKSEDGKLNDRQKEWQARLEQAGYAWRLCRSMQEAVDTVEKYLEMEGK